jgi:phosphatidylinositol alpha-mannosyltransferase
MIASDLLARAVPGGVEGSRVCATGGRRFRVAITNPFVWPHVRRGAERLVNDLAHYLTGRGHRVEVFAMGPAHAVEDRASVTYRLLAQRGSMRLRQFNSLHRFALRLQPELCAGDFDVVYCLTYFDAFAALRARHRAHARFKVVFHLAGIATRRYFRAVPLDAWFFRTVLREADRLLVVSPFARDCLERDFGRQAAVLPPPVDTTQFTPAATEAPADGSSGMTVGPRILFVGDVDEPRKGARVLCTAFARIKEVHSAAELVFSGRASEATRTMLLALPDIVPLRGSVHFLGVGAVEDLAALYRSASVTVLPAVWETFGMALVESLACGTPVVCTRHGGITGLVDTDAVGRMFDPGPFVDSSDNATGLAQAMLEVLASGKSPETTAACRARARQFSWTTLGPQYEAILQELTADGSAHAIGAKSPGAST